MDSYFIYGSEAAEYLKTKDRKLAPFIDQIGHIYKPVDRDLFSSVVHQIIGQQISTKALNTIWNRLQDDLGDITAQSILNAGTNRIQSYGTTFRKASYICDFARKASDGSFDQNEIMKLPDDEAIRHLTSLKGIGTWTAEMILMFGMQRQDVLSFGDLAILRGMRMVYRHRTIGKDRFERYRRRYSPYGSVASLYLWAVSSGAVSGITDPADIKRGKK
ncbi:MAG: DNA-3-methyladenine glycosylase 2 family protein [Eubacteriales bacterium]|nr:DNA-3-methyladenine glycosylase 2 family protein [Eubacteriales bacterium]